MPDEITYRLFRDDDLPGLLRLWEQESGWGAITVEQWRRWYLEGPNGPAIVVVATDGNEMLGQEVFAPATLLLHGEHVPVLRLTAPILSRRLRRGSARSMAHPVVQLYWLGAKAGAARGFGLIFALPEHAWLPFFRWLPEFETAEFPCVACGLTGPMPTGGVDAVALPGPEFGAEYAALWDSAVQEFPIRCGIARTPAWIAYKNNGHVALEIRDRCTGALLGYTATKRKTGLLADILARSPADLPRVVAATVQWFTAAHAAGKCGAIDSLTAMQTATLAPALERSGFQPVEYRFAFVCNSIAPGLPAEAVAPDRWYVTPGD